MRTIDYTVGGVSAKDGSAMWNMDLGGTVSDGVTVGLDSSFVSVTYGSMDLDTGNPNPSYLYRAESGTGRVLWQYETADESFDYVTNWGSDVIVQSPRAVCRIHGGSGKVKWALRAPLSAGRLTYAGTFILIGGSSGSRELLCVDAESGESVWRRKLPAVITSNPLVINDRVMIATEDQDVHNFAVVDGSDGVLLSLPSAGLELFRGIGGVLIWTRMGVYEIADGKLRE